MTKLKPPAKCQASLPGMEPAHPAAVIVEYVDGVMPTIGRIATQRKADALAEVERCDAVEGLADPRRPGIYAAGDEVVFTARFVQTANGAPLELASVFTVQECACGMCSRGTHVCTTEWLEHYECFRHVSRSAIRHRGGLFVDECQMGLQPLISMPRVAPGRYIYPHERKVPE